MRCINALHNWPHILPRTIDFALIKFSEKMRKFAIMAALVTNSVLLTEFELTGSPVVRAAARKQIKRRLQNIPRRVRLETAEMTLAQTVAVFSPPTTPTPPDE